MTARCFNLVLGWMEELAELGQRHDLTWVGRFWHPQSPTLWVSWTQGMRGGEASGQGEMSGLGGDEWYDRGVRGGGNEVWL